MPWAMETKAGFVWAIGVVIAFLISIVAMAGLYGGVLPRPWTPLFLLLPFAVYLGFLAWVNRVK